MALKDLLVHVDRSRAGVARMHLAADLAARHGARLTILNVRAKSVDQERRLKAGEMGLVPAQAAGVDGEAVAGEIETDSKLLRGLLGELQDSHQLNAEWCEVSGNLAKIVIQRSRYADLTIVGHDVSGNDDDLPDGYSFAEAILFQSGKPLIIIPPGVIQATLGRNVALAWNGSRPAARALSDALALIERAERTTVLIANPQTAGGSEAPTATDILANIGHHTVNFDTVLLDCRLGSLGDLLQTRALAGGADLLVAGAYGQPRLWEKMLGGTTKDLLSRMRMPILMSH